MPDELDGLIERNRRLSEEIRRRVDQLAAINTVAATVSQSLDLDITLQTALDAVLGVIQVDSAGISLVDDAKSELVLRAQRGWRHDFVSQPMRIPLGKGLSGQVVRADEVLVTGDLTGDARLHVRAFAAEGVQAMAMVPMHARGRVVGVLSVMSHAPYNFLAEEITMLRAIADQVGVALDNARLYEQAREQSSRLSAVLDSSADAVIATDSAGRIDLINARAEALLDLRRESALGLPLAEAPLPPRLRDELRRALLADSPANHVLQVTLEDRYLSAIVSPVYAQTTLDGSQPAEGWVIVVQDITLLQQAERARINFIHDAAHDLRNPLGVTLHVLEVLQSESNPSPEHREMIALGLSGLDRMQELIETLLNLEQLESGVGLTIRPLDPRELLERAATDSQIAIRQRGQTLRLLVPDALPPVAGDMHWLHRALLNLLGNANKYTPPGGEIALCAFAQDDELFLEVRDTGPGITLDAQERLFERFYRLPDDRARAKGAGLGLAIVKSVAEQHGGRVYVQSQPGQGSAFGLVLPLLPQAARAGE